VLDARFSPDGKRLASLVMALDGKPIPDDDGPEEAVTSLELWDAQTGKRLRVTELHHKGNSGTISIRPGGRQVAVSIMGSPVKLLEHRVSVVEAETGQLVRTLEGKAINEALAYSPDGSLLVGPSDTEALAVWDAETLKLVQKLDAKESTIRNAAFSPDGTRLAVVGDTGRATIWSVPGWKPLHSLRVSDQWALGCMYSRDGKSLATLGRNFIKIWDGVTGEFRFLIRGAAFAMDFSPDGARLAAAGDANTVRFWDAREEQGALVYHPKESPYFDYGYDGAAYSRDGRQVIDAYGTLIDVATGAVVQAIPVPEGETIYRTAFYPDKDHVVVFRSGSGSKSDYKPGELVLFDLQTRHELKKIDGVPSPFDLAVSADGRWLMALNFVEGDETAMRRELIIRNASTWELVLALRDPPLSGRNAVFMKDSNAILVGRNDRICVLEIPSGRELKVYGPLPDQPLAVAISPDGRFVASTPQSSATVRGTSVHVWDAATGAEVDRISQIGGEWVSVLSFSPDGRRLVSGGSDGKINIWDMETGLNLLTLSGHKSWLWQARFSPDGGRIVSCSRDRTLRIWDGRRLQTESAR
jgi:WD40 repeat protein